MTFISNSKKFIFIHPLKCAGTSVEIALSETLQWNDLVLGSTNYGDRFQQVYRSKFSLYKHSSASEVETVVGDRVWNDYFTFSVVRHPCDRMASFYTYLKYMKSLNRPAIEKWAAIKALNKSSNFSEFLVNVSTSGGIGVVPQFDFLLNKQKSKIDLDYVGKFENLASDWQYICHQLKINIPLPHANKSRTQKQKWEDYYSDDDLEFMAQRYKVDFDMFNYSI